MSLPRYEQYKDSGVPWLGEVPAHWEVTPLYSTVFERNESNKGMLEDNLLSLSFGRIVQKDISSNDGLLPESFETYQIVRAGDIVFRLTDLQNDKRSLRSALVEQTGIITAAYLVVTPTNECSGYMSFLFRAYDATKAFYSMGGGLRQSMKFSDLNRLPTLKPPALEQTAIAAFLDRETAKIDDLVAEQRNLIGLLKEKRQALISHAVTKGLDPAAPMKDSGVEWLGKVPKHWLVMPIKLAARLESGHTPSRSHPEYWENCTVPWFTLADVWQIREGKSDRVSETKEQVSELGLANSSARLLPRNTVMLSRTASVGFSAIMNVDMATTQDFANWVCGPTLIPEFLLFVLRSMQGEFRRIMMGSTHNTIYMPDIQALRFALPPLSEQQEIIDYVTTWAAQCDALVTEAETATTLLQERRTALISAAVTGKIDVRNRMAVQPVPELEVA